MFGWWCWVGVYRGRIGHVLLVVIIVVLVCGRREEVLLLQLLRICRMRQCRAMGERGGWAVMLSKASSRVVYAGWLAVHHECFMGSDDPPRDRRFMLDAGVHTRC